jgi:putative ABC transport system ATP-binding protein
MSKEVISFKDVYKIYNNGTVQTNANNGVTFSIKECEFVLILGQSGAGKTTILNLLGGMDKATKGEILIDDVDITKFNDKELTLYRRNDVGFVFQFYNLMPNMTALENVELSSELNRKTSYKPLDILTKVGLSDKLNNFPSSLSGGEQQRVSIARAISKNPKLLLCDEPTGALDYETGKQVLKLLYSISKQENKTVIVVTHNQGIIPMADHIIRVKNGKVIEDYYNTIVKDVDEIQY